MISSIGNFDRVPEGCPAADAFSFAAATADSSQLGVRSSLSGSRRRSGEEDVEDCVAEEGSVTSKTSMDGFSPIAE